MIWGFPKSGVPGWSPDGNGIKFWGCTVRDPFMGGGGGVPYIKCGALRKERTQKGESYPFRENVAFYEVSKRKGLWG